jgi:WD40 repeat protein
MLFSKYPATVLIAVLVSLPLASQQSNPVPTAGACGMPLFGAINNDRNLFSEQQEEWLGEIMDQGVRRDLHVIEDPDGYLQHLGERLLAQLPPTKIHYHLVIVDSPELNSFGLAGGRIYIYRRMIAFAKTEDELAALVGHEIGHQITHQAAIEISDWFRELGITSLGDRQDVYNKWNQFQDNVRKLKKGVKESQEEQDQVTADRIGLYAMTRAGYDPAQFVAFADRSLETKGKTGNFWSDLFGTTTPESKRLREILRRATPIPPNCIAQRADTTAFARWQQAVVEAKRETAKEALPGLVKKVPLHPPLRNELTFLQFSPDGKYLLAQDDSSIFVLTREPMANLFRIDAPGANAPQFTPDSAFIVFHDDELRVQKWEIASRRQVFIRALSSSCAYSALSPTGQVFACVKPDRDLQMVDVKTGEAFFSKKNLFELTPMEVWFAELAAALEESEGHPVIPVHMAFSPDGRYFLAGHGNYTLGYDVSNRTEIKLPGRVRDLIRSGFAFTTPDEVFGVEAQKAVRLRFPGGEVVDQFPFSGHGHFAASTKPGYIVASPAGAAPIGALDLSAKKFVLGYRTMGFAVYGDVYAGDDVDGRLTIKKIADHSLVAKIELPDSPLAGAKASAFSSNGKLLAVSGRTRAAIWKLDTGDEIGFSNDFDSAFFDQETLIVKYPKQEKVPDRIMEVAGTPLAARKLYDLDSGEENTDAAPGLRTPRSRAWQDADLLFRIEPVDPKKFDHFRLDVRDIRTHGALWQLSFDRPRPRFYYSPLAKTITFVVSDYGKIKEAAKQDPALAARMDAIKGKDGKAASYLIQVYEARSRKPLGNLLVDTGNLSFRVGRAVTAGDNVFVSDSENRTLVYSLKTGEQRGKVLGDLRALSADGGKMLVENDTGVADLYDAASLQSLAHYRFPSRLTHAEFASQNNLMVLTADQTFYQFDLGGTPKEARVE